MFYALTIVFIMFAKQFHSCIQPIATEISSQSGLHAVVVLIQEGLTALMMASQHGHLEIVESLVKARADANICENVRAELQ